MKVVVTCGPSYEPIDEVRRITNFSTGELGTLLSERLSDAGFETVCLRGVSSTHAAPQCGTVLPFSTNDDLANGLQELAAQDDVLAVFHTAALCDYRVGSVTGSDGQPIHGAKIASRGGSLTVHLEPAPKLIASLRDWFPRSLLVGWKYELDGTQADSIERARTQVIQNRTDACIANGKAYGDGFGFVSGEGFLDHVPNKLTLCDYLVSWLRSNAGAAQTS